MVTTQSWNPVLTAVGQDPAAMSDMGDHLPEDPSSHHIIGAYNPTLLDCMGPLLHYYDRTAALISNTTTIPPVQSHPVSTQIPTARHSTSHYQGHGVDEPQAVRIALANSLRSQPSNPGPSRLTFGGSQQPTGNGGGAQGTTLPAGQYMFDLLAGTPSPEATDPGEPCLELVQK